MTNQDNKPFGVMLQELMEQHNLTQVELAEKANTNQPTISAIWSGRMRCGINLGKRLAQGLGLSELETLRFLSFTKKARWKGFKDSNESILMEALLSKIEKNEGVKLSDIKAVIKPDPQNLLLVIKDGRILKLDFILQRKCLTST